MPNIKVNESELSISYPNGSRIRLFGADNADALRGQYFDGIIADEYGDWKPSVWGYVIRPALADRKGWAIFIGTPKGRNQFYEIYSAACNLPNWFALMLRADESGILDAEEMQEMRDDPNMNDDIWRQEMECNFDAALPGAVWGKELYQLEIDGRFCEVPHNPAYPVSTAWDIGRSDDTAIWWYQVIDNQIRVIDFHSSSLKDVAFYAEQILGIEIKIDFVSDELVVHRGADKSELAHRKAYRYAKNWLPHDARPKTLASKKSVIEQLAAVIGLQQCAITPSMSIQDGIQSVRMLMSRISIDLRCDPGFQAIKQYQREYDEDKKCFRDKPRHDWTSHSADAMRYLAISCKGSEPPPLSPDKIRSIAVGYNTATLDDLWKEKTSRTRRTRI